MLNTYKVVMYMERSYHFDNIHTPLMMAQDWAESSREPINYGRFINQFLPDAIKSMQWLKIQKCVEKGCLYCLIKYVLTKKYWPNTHTSIYIYIYRKLVLFVGQIMFYIRYNVYVDKKCVDKEISTIVTVSFTLFTIYKPNLGGLGITIRKNRNRSDSRKK